MHLTPPNPKSELPPKTNLSTFSNKNNLLLLHHVTKTFESKSILSCQKVKSRPQFTTNDSEKWTNNECPGLGFNECNRRKTGNIILL